MSFPVIINDTIEPQEVPSLRQKVGWGPRAYEYPALLERCMFHGSIRDEQGRLIAFGYLCGMGLEHGYLEDVMVDPACQRQGLGRKLVTALLQEAKRRGTLIITVTFDPENQRFYESCGFTTGLSGTIVY